MPYRRRRRSPRIFSTVYKKVLNFAPSSHTAGLKVDFDLALGVDSLALGQTGPTDNAVPTGSTIDYIEIQYGVINQVAVSNFCHVSIQNLVSGQSATVSPNVVGGNPQRNQVLHQEMRSVGKEQNMTYVLKFRVPKHLRRMREGSRLFFTVLNTAVVTDTCQVIYRVKR